MATIVILEHRLQRDVGLPYMVYEFATRWRAQGHRVLVHHGAESPPSGDLAILNVDLTVVPEQYQALTALYPTVVNGRVLDISKRRFSQILLERSSAWPGPVIVKSDANFGGRSEQLLRSMAAHAGEAAAIPAGPVLDEYPVYASISEVPDDVWSTPGLIVEKFQPEHDERGYYIRTWIFFGDRETSSRFRAADPVIKSHHILERQEAEVPAEIRAWRRKLGFNFGKFDYVRHAKRFVLLDVNRTPAFPPHLSARAAPVLDSLAAGLQAFLNKRA